MGILGLMFWKATHRVAHFVGDVLGELHWGAFLWWIDHVEAPLWHRANS